MKLLEPKVPSDLQKEITSKFKVKELWIGLTPIARTDFISWVEGAKKAETRKSRIERVANMLLSGKRRPCCYAVVPMNFYKALGSDPKAKTGWKNLTPTEKRGFVYWVEDAKDGNEKKVRIIKACSMLSSGKRRP